MNGVDNTHVDRRITGNVSNCSEGLYQNLQAYVSNASDTLGRLVAAAEEKGVDCRYEKLSILVAKAFTRYAEFDFNHQHDQARRYKHPIREPIIGGHGPIHFPKPPIGLACIELNNTVKLLSHAIEEIELLTSSPTFKRLPVPDNRMLGVREENGYFFRPETGRPVFPGGYDQGIWKYWYGFPTDTETQQVVDLGQDSDELAISIATVMPINESYINETFLKFLKSRLDYFGGFGLSISIFTGCELPDWAVTKYPDLQLFMASNCHVNLDVPVLDLLWNRTLTAVYSYVYPHSALHSFRLGNEVWFGIYGNKTIIPQVTLDRWHMWLDTAYHGNLSDMNHLYGTKYASFNDVPLPGTMQRGSLHPRTDKDHVITGLDFAAFVNYRSFTYFGNMISTLKHINPSVKTHIKFVNKGTFSPWAYGGVDRLALNDVTGWVGCDTRIMPYPVQQITTPSRNHLQYALDWLPAALGYTFMRTTADNKVVVDQEIHPVSTSSDRNTSIAFGHMTAAMWVAHLHGISMNLIWNWNRYPNGTPSDSLLGTMLTQPQTLNDYARTMSYINAISEVVHALATAPRPVCLFMNGLSKHVSEKPYWDIFVDTFEGLVFFGPQPTIITDFMLNKNSSYLHTCEVFIVPVTSYLKQSVFSVMTQYQKAGGAMLFISGTTETSEDPIFAVNEKGIRRPASELTWTRQITRLPDAAPRQLLTQLMPHLKSVTKDVHCLDSPAGLQESNDAPSWGLICRYASSGGSVADGPVVAVVNTLTVAIKTYITHTKLAAAGGLMGRDLYLSQTINLSLPLEVRPLQVLVLELHVLAV